MKKDSPIEFSFLSLDDFEDLKEMVLALYKENGYGEKITIQKIKTTINELSVNSMRGAIYIFKRLEKIVGYAILIFYWSNEYGGNIIHIDELYVKPPFRRQGIATQFLEFIKIKYRRSTKAIQLEVTKTNKKALIFYIKSGFILNENQGMIKKL